MYIEEDEDLIRLLEGPVTPLPQLEQIHTGVAGTAQSYALINRYARSNPHHGLGFRAGQWFETTGEVYAQFLEAVPPLDMSANGFVVGECTMEDLFEAFFRFGDRYFCAVIAWAGHGALVALEQALLAEVAP